MTPDEEEGPFYGGDIQDAVERARAKRERPPEPKPVTPADPSFGTFNEKTRRWSGAPPPVGDTPPPVKPIAPRPAPAAAPAAAPPQSESPPLSPPPEPPDVAPPPEAPPFTPNAFPPPAAEDPAKEARLKAISSLQGMLDKPQAAQGMSDADLVSAQQSDAEQRKHNDFTRALQSMLLRKPYEPSEPMAATDLMQRQKLAQKPDEPGRAGIAEALGRLAGEKSEDPQLAAFRAAEAAKWQNDDARAKRAADDKTAATQKASDEETASLSGERQAITADPRAKAVGLTPEMVANADRKGLAEIRARMDSFKPQKGGAGSGGLGGDKRLTPAALKDLGDLDAADKQLQDLEAEGSKIDLGSMKNSVISLAPERLKANTDIGRYEDLARQTMQGVGTILEHGKLAAGDEVKYKRMLPEAGDDATTLHHKVQSLRGFLHELKARHSEQYSGGGYHVPGSGTQWKNTKTGRVVQGTAEQLKASKNPDDWVQM